MKQNLNWERELNWEPQLDIIKTLWNGFQKELTKHFIVVTWFEYSVKWLNKLSKEIEKSVQPY